MTCCACSKPGIAFVIDGVHHKPVCDQHGRMYRQQGYRITGGPNVTVPATRPYCLRCEVPIYQDGHGVWRREATAVADCPRNPARDGHEPMPEAD